MMNNNTNRISWIDDARMFAMCCVVLCHIKSAMGTPLTMGFSYWIVCFNMPLFVLLAAYMGYEVIGGIKNYDNWLSYIEKISLRITLPTLTASTLFSLLEAIAIMSIKAIAVNIILLGIIGLLYTLYRKRPIKRLVKFVLLALIPVTLYRCGGYWFLCMLQILMIVISLLYLSLNSFINKILLGGGGMWLIISILSVIITFYIKHYYLIEMCPYFIVGLMARRYNLIEKMSNTSKYIWVSFLIVGIVLFAYLYSDCYFYNRSLYDLANEGRLYIWPLRILCGLSWCAAFLFLIKRYSTHYSLFSKCGTITIGIYLYHIPIFNYLMQQNISLHLPVIQYWVVGFGIGVFILVLTTLLCFLMKRYKITRYLLLGEKI